MVFRSALTIVLVSLALFVASVGAGKMAIENPFEGERTIICRGEVATAPAEWSESQVVVCPNRIGYGADGLKPGYALIVEVQTVFGPSIEFIQ